MYRNSKYALRMIYSRNSSKNDILVVLIFEKIGVESEVMDIIACYRLGKTNRAFVKRLNGKDSQYILEKKYKLRNIALYNHDENESRNRSRKIAINQGLCPYYRKLFGLVKDLSNEGLIDSFCILNGTIKIRESSQSKPVSITHESALQFLGVHLPDMMILNSSYDSARFFIAPV